MIVPFKYEDIDEVVNIRYKELSSGLLSKLGKKFLYEYSKSLLKTPGIFVFVAKNNDRIVGFVSLTDEIERLHLRVIRNNFWGIFKALIEHLFLHPTSIGKIWETLSYSGFSNGGAELLSMAVDSSHQRKGWGKKIFQKVKREFRKKGIKYFRVSTYEKDIGANFFYKKMGCNLEKSFNFRGEKMNYYIYKVE